MYIWTIFFCVLPTIISTITVSSNGNSPEIKMVGGMMVDAQKEPLSPILAERRTKPNYDKRKLSNRTKLSINERYRRLIPYMTFYYANDLVSPTTERQVAKNIEVEKIELVEAKTITHRDPQPRKIVYNPNGNIPLYQGNRLTQYNIASSNPSKFLLKEAISAPQSFRTANYNPFLSNHRILPHNDYEYDRIVQKPIYKTQSAPFSQPTRNPYVDLYNKDELGNLQYFISEKDLTPRYKLVPYEQTPPVKVLTQNENLYHSSRPLNQAPVIIPKEQVYIKPRPSRPQYIYENPSIQYSTNVRKQPVVVSESYYEKRRPQSPIVEPVIESGFKPILNPNIHTTEAPVYESNLAPILPAKQFESNQHQVIEVSTVVPKSDDLKPNYYQYDVTPTYQPPQLTPSNSITLGDLLSSLQLNKSIPKPITRENVGASIRTLLQVLNVLKAYPQDEIKTPVLSTPKPFIENKVVELIPKPVDVTPVPVVNEDTDFQDEPYLAPVNTPSQHLDDHSSTISSQRFPQPVNSDDEGGTPGRPGVDYPVLTTIPETAFDCKTQRYKGFFADPETRCQVWHYCDLNGGQASFLCPNGTIFSQAALTCDWWFNVRCASTTQLYVLNESLYKYILPHSPKFPEDYSGPLVDKYLTLKFKEMEEQFKKNKNRQSASEKMDQDEEDTTEDSTEKESATEAADIADKSAVSEASVIVESPGTSGNVERLDD